MLGVDRHSHHAQRADRHVIPGLFMVATVATCLAVAFKLFGEATPVERSTNPSCRLGTLCGRPWLMRSVHNSWRYGISLRV